MKQKFLVAKPRPVFDVGPGSQSRGFSKRSYADQSYRYMNMVNSEIEITALRNLPNRYGFGSGGATEEFGFQNNYPVSNIYSSLHIHKECKTNGAVDIGSGKYESGISLKIPNLISDGANGTDTFNTVALHFNVFDANIYSNAKYIYVGFRDIATNTAVGLFKFRLWDYLKYQDDTEAGDVIDADGFLETSKWNKNSGVLRIDKELFVQYKQKTAFAGVEAWNDFTNLQNVYMDVWFQSGNSLEANEGEDFSGMRFSISNIVVGQSYDILVDEGLDESIDDLSIRTKNSKTGTTFIEKNSFNKKLDFKISLFTDSEINDFIKNIALGCLSSPIYFFPGTEIREGKLPFSQLPFGPREDISPYMLDALWGGLYLMSEPKIANSQYNVHGTSISLNEYK